ncbi:hypothetical protein [Bradyrhizobium sp. dw_78]|nr:hypothetical protein [Bradyrhizobium sp. dw_78]
MSQFDSGSRNKQKDRPKTVFVQIGETVEDQTTANATTARRIVAPNKQ